jgi:hypothetical protein
MLVFLNHSYRFVVPNADIHNPRAQRNLRAGSRRSVRDCAVQSRAVYNPREGTRQGKAKLQI